MKCILISREIWSKSISVYICFPHFHMTWITHGKFGIVTRKQHRVLPGVRAVRDGLCDLTVQYFNKQLASKFKRTDDDILSWMICRGRAGLGFSNNISQKTAPLYSSTYILLLFSIIQFVTHESHWSFPVIFISLHLKRSNFCLKTNHFLDSFFRARNWN